MEVKDLVASMRSFDDQAADLVSNGHELARVAMFVARNWQWSATTIDRAVKLVPPLAKLMEKLAPIYQGAQAMALRAVYEAALADQEIADELVGHNIISRTALEAAKEF